jgi:hypothetical protein
MPNANGSRRENSSRQPGNQSVIIADGYGIKISVYRGIGCVIDHNGAVKSGSGDVNCRAYLVAVSSPFTPRTSSYNHRASPGRLQVSQPAKPASDLQPSDLVSAEAWQRILPLIPPEPVVSRHKYPRADNRAVLAGILLYERGGISWRDIPRGLGVAGETCRNRWHEWQQSGISPAILIALER